MTVEALTAEAMLQAGQPLEALKALQAKVRDNPADPALRVFLFQLLTVCGEYERALNQLNVVRDLNPQALPMVNTYRELLQAEPLRQAIFNGKKLPLLFGQPQPWAASLLEALQLTANNHFAEAQHLRQAAFEQIPTRSGSINDQPFEWIADADTRIGPFLEAILNGKLFWIPFDRIQRIEFHRPEDLRDMVWLPAEFTWNNGGEAVGFIPSRYPGSETHADGRIPLARMTEWVGAPEETWLGFGQRILVTDQDEYPLLEVERIEFTIDEAD